MNQATIQLIIALIPLAERLVFDLGGKMIELDTKEIRDPEDLIRMLEASKSENWPRLKFARMETKD